MTLTTCNEWACGTREDLMDGAFCDILSKDFSMGSMVGVN
jgi:hypothetical protein